MRFTTVLVATAVAGLTAVTDALSHTTTYSYDANGNPLRSFRGLLDHLATLTRNQVRYHGASTDIPVLADPTPDQRRAFDLLDTPIPLTATA